MSHYTRFLVNSYAKLWEKYIAFKTQCGWIYLLWRETKGGSPQEDVFIARGSAEGGGWLFVDALMSVHHLVDLALPHTGEGVARRWGGAVVGETWGLWWVMGAGTGKWEDIRELRPPSASHWSHQCIRLLEGWGGVLWISYDNNGFLKENYGYIITKHNWRLWNQPLFSWRKPFILQEVEWEVSRGELRAISRKQTISLFHELNPIPIWKPLYLLTRLNLCPWVFVQC